MNNYENMNKKHQNFRWNRPFSVNWHCHLIKRCGMTAAHEKRRRNTYAFAMRPVIFFY